MRLTSSNTQYTQYSFKTLLVFHFILCIVSQNMLIQILRNARSPNFQLKSLKMHFPFQCLFKWDYFLNFISPPNIFAYSTWCLMRHVKWSPAHILVPVYKTQHWSTEYLTFRYQSLYFIVFTVCGVLNSAY